MKWYFVLALLLIMGLFAGCTSTNQANVTPTQTPDVINATNVSVVHGCMVIDFGHGVLFFNCMFEQFAPAMAEYIDIHPGIKICSMTGPNLDSLDVWSKGYYVIVDDC